MFFTKVGMSIYELWGIFFDIPGYLKYYNLKKGDVVIDAGAYSGIFSKYAAKKVGEKGKVIAFEPDPENFEILKQRLKRFKNVRLLQKGLFDCNKVLTLKRHILWGSIGSTVTNKNCSKSNFKILVGTLDNELEKLGISSVDFIKMDIEGAELEAFKGMKKVLGNSSPNLAIACYHKRNNEQTGVLLMKMLSKYYSNLKTGNLLHKTLFAQRKHKK